MNNSSLTIARALAPRLEEVSDVTLVRHLAVRASGRRSRLQLPPGCLRAGAGCVCLQLLFVQCVRERLIALGLRPRVSWACLRPRGRLSRCGLHHCRPEEAAQTLLPTRERRGGQQPRELGRARHGLGALAEHKRLEVVDVLFFSDARRAHAANGPEDCALRERPVVVAEAPGDPQVAVGIAPVQLVLVVELDGQCVRVARRQPAE
eukprot:CAMPEP_0180107846 /NCGR_PEP_ID=MMETSP0985-20121206/33535_1 /TAXON_ID=483367 /ORGANISM="non described non described, Strain CCMP 2436" /LENGTH=205 /DNA_ID=CAMNT_0022045447 /DNA_START=22 /DNA_END=640 /DNA_ORIENTATION=+